MCGIAGVYHLDQRPIDQGLLQSMGDLIAHRGPDDEGFYNHKGVGLVNRRLAIIDLTPSGHQPMSNEDGSIWITFNGEIYNYLELRKQLENLGHVFLSQSDTEAIIHAYEEWGFESTAHLRGMFAYAIWDMSKQLLFAARDRLGKKPFFYTLTRNTFVFGSELRCLLQHPEVERTINLDAINAFFNRVYVPAPLTAINGISKLPAAHYLVLRNGKIELQRYWKVDFEKKITASEEEVSERL
jgi:asparagine synthase (glutamine-hydrolysing)